MKSDIEKRCREKELELIEKYFGKLVEEAAFERPETIGIYDKDLPLKIEAEYRDFLSDIWKDYSKEPLILEEQKLRSLLTDNISEKIEAAYKDASKITFMERITKSNHEDVSYYKGLLKEYTVNLLSIMRVDFLEEISGKHITGKTFDD